MNAYGNISHYSSSSESENDSIVSSWGESKAIATTPPLSIFQCKSLMWKIQKVLRAEKKNLIGLKGFERDYQKRVIHSLECDYFRVENRLLELSGVDLEMPQHGDVPKYDPLYKCLY